MRWSVRSTLREIFTSSSTIIKDMLKFYRNAAIAALLLIVFTTLLVYGGIVKSNISKSLFPERDKDFLWATAIEPSTPQHKTLLSVKSEVGTIDYEFFLDSNEPYPYSHYSLYFIEPEQSYKIVDLTQYSSISFKVLCDPKNVLLLVIFSFDEKVTDLIKPVTRRVSSTAFSCENQWNILTIDFNELDTPHWWLDRNGFEFSDTGYRLDKTLGFAFVNSLQSPKNTLSHVKITDIKLIGSKASYLYASIAISLVCWILFIIGLMRQYVVVLIVTLKEKIQLDQTLIAYKKLSIEPQKDKAKSAVLRLMATEYANPELSLEMAAASLGINRTKINDILKEELGLTFSTYLNKLRLTEAARLLSENEDANVSEIAYSVGYNNVSYFNKLFKNEYGCAPKTFKLLGITNITN
jgi:AraC-like DNA-binding protein